MLSRLKRRSASQSTPERPAPPGSPRLAAQRDADDDDEGGEHHDENRSLMNRSHSNHSLAPPSPTPSHRSYRREASLPVPDHDTLALPSSASALASSASVAGASSFSSSSATSAAQTQPNFARRNSRSSSFGSYTDASHSNLVGGLPSAASTAPSSAGAPLPTTRSSKTLFPASTKGASDRYLVVNRSTSLDDDALYDIGSGSLSLDHLTGAGDASVSGPPGTTWVARAPELMRLDVHHNGSGMGSSSGPGSSAEDDLRTPVPGDGPTNLPDAYFGVASSSSIPTLSSSPTTSLNGPSFEAAHTNANGRSAALNVANGRPRAHTSSEGSANPSQTSALAGNHVGPGMPASPNPSKPLPESRDAQSPVANSVNGAVSAVDAAAIANRPGSRSSSVNSHDAGGAPLLRPPLQSSPSSSRQPKRQKSSQGIAGAIALSGVALASPAQNLRQPLALSRTSTRGSFEVGSGAESDGGMSSNYGDHYTNGFISIDSLGDFDDALSNLGTGYAVASSKRNAEFHAIFKNIPDDDYLIEDYGCALQREILIQGRLYISEHHLSFNANIFGWVTTHTLPFAEVVSIEKRMTAYVIPNAILVTTLHARYTFASFLSRDPTYDLICNIWRMVHPVVPTSAALPDSTNLTAASIHHDSDDEEGDDDSLQKETKKGTKKRLKGLRKRGGTNEDKKGDALTPAGSNLSASLPSHPNPRGGGVASPAIGGSNGVAKPTAFVHPVTTDTCAMLKNLKEVCMDTVFPSAPEKIYNLMFTSGFMKTFWVEDQKILDLQISDWAPEKSGSNLLARSMSYIKPLTGSIGPKQTKCMITDETAHVDFDDYVCVITTTRTPDVPSGGSFAVKTRTSMTWAKGNSCRVVVTTGVEWTGRSMLKGIIERSCIEGQKTYHTDLEKAMRAYIHQHRSEFLEEGQQPSSSAENEGMDDADRTDLEGIDNDDEEGGLDKNAGSSLQRRKSLAPKHEAGGVLCMITDMLGGMFEVITGQGSSGGGLSPTSILLALVIVGLVLSNVWTLASRSPSSSTSPVSPRPNNAPRKIGSERTPDQVADAVRDVLRDYFAASPPSLQKEDGSSGAASMVSSDDEWARRESDEIRRILNGLQERIDGLRKSLDELD